MRQNTGTLVYLLFEDPFSRVRRPICPQFKTSKTFEEAMFCLDAADIPKQSLKQNEFDCLNMNITVPAGLTSHSRVPVMAWVHGYVLNFCLVRLGLQASVALIEGQALTGFMMEGR